MTEVAEIEALQLQMEEMRAQLNSYTANVENRMKS
jgi:hypothetical protein